MSKTIILIAVWLVSPTDEMYRLGIRDVDLVDRYSSLEECRNTRDKKRNSPDPYNPSLKFICIDLTAKD